MASSALKLLAVAAILSLISIPVSADEYADKYRVVILPFAENGNHIADYGKRISDELTVNLFNVPDVELVDGSKAESQLYTALAGGSEMLGLPQATEIGRVTGASLVVTGAIVESGDSIIMVSRVISPETNRVFMETVRGRRDDFDVLMGVLASRVSDVIRIYAIKLVS